MGFFRVRKNCILLLYVKPVTLKLNKEYKRAYYRGSYKAGPEVCLLEQPYVKAEDGKQTVAKYLQQVSKEVGADIKITGFVRFETGEGLEKKNEDFAAEVAAQMNA